MSYMTVSNLIKLSHFACCCCCWVASVVSDSVRPHGRQPTRLPRPWDSPGKNTGVGCHFLLQCMKVKSEREVTQSCPTLSDLMDCSLPGSSILGIFQARVLEWAAIATLFTCYQMLPRISPLHWDNLRANVCLIQLPALPKVLWHLVEQVGQVPALHMLFSMFRLPFPIKNCVVVYLIELIGVWNRDRYWKEPIGLVVGL